MRDEAKYREIEAELPLNVMTIDEIKSMELGEPPPQSLSRWLARSPCHEVFSITLPE
jgi:hypothetical protein